MDLHEAETYLRTTYASNIYRRFATPEVGDVDMISVAAASDAVIRAVSVEVDNGQATQELEETKGALAQVREALTQARKELDQQSNIAWSRQDELVDFKKQVAKALVAIDKGNLSASDAFDELGIERPVRRYKVTKTIEVEVTIQAGDYWDGDASDVDDKVEVDSDGQVTVSCYADLEIVDISSDTTNASWEELEDED